ncbi:MAG: PEP-CTERM sorting domain-containing protein [Planctomycetaceae bacterium]
MKKVLVRFLACLLPLLGLAQAANADTIVYTPSPADLYDLDHHKLYTVRFSGVHLGGQSVTGATLSIRNIRNWDANPNTLFVHLLDTAVYAGVRGFLDDDPSNVPVTDITDDFADPRYHGGTDARGAASPWLVAPGTADLFLFAQSFTTTAVNFEFAFNTAQIAALNAYIAAGGDFALGFDPDCHYWNDGIKLTLQTAVLPTPEPGTLALLAVALGTAAWRRHARRSA